MTARRLAAALAVALATAATAAGAPPKPPDVLVKVLASSQETYVGRSLVYTIFVSNVGGADASAITVDVTLAGDAGAAVAEVTETLATCSTTQLTHVTCSLDLLQRSKSEKIRVKVKAARGGSIDVSTKTTASGDVNAANDSAQATTVVHPGKAGPPEVRVGRTEGPATPDPKDRKGRVAILAGKLDVSEPGQLTVAVVDRAGGANLPILVGSSIGDTRLRARQTTVNAPVGDASTTGSTQVPYSIRLPIAKLLPKHAYALVVDVVDLESTQGKQLVVPFRLAPAKAKKP